MAPAKSNLTAGFLTSGNPSNSLATDTPGQSSQPQTFGTFNTLLSPSSPQVPPSSPPATTVGYTATPFMSPTSSRSATTSPMSAGTTSWVATSAATTTKSSSGDSARAWQATGPGGGKSIRDVERVKAQAGIWGVQNQMASLAGGFGSFAKPTAQSVGGSCAPAGAGDLLL
ncbi:hypothetical protein BGW80DRAFT_1256018 [Lactifluus volemus]|nr:hypothetical protein BGW80DRAFT_1256018 [Lactifluus volemus]